MTDEERIIEIETEISEIKAAMKAIRLGGQEYRWDSGGSQRSVTMADYQALKNELHGLRLKLRELNGETGQVLSAGW